MRARHQLLIVVSAVLLCSAMLGQADRGYLVASGPAPLRFLPAPEPPLRLAHEAAPEPVEHPIQTNIVVDHSNEIIHVASPLPLFTFPSYDPYYPQSQSPPANIQTNSVPGVVQEGDVVSPQMLLKYFNRSSNGVSSSVFLPMNMPSAPPVQTGSSKAGYTNAP
jgi:hypothetical protein